MRVISLRAVARIKNQKFLWCIIPPFQARMWAYKRSRRRNAHYPVSLYPQQSFVLPAPEKNPRCVLHKRMYLSFIQTGVETISLIIDVCSTFENCAVGCYSSKSWKLKIQINKKKEKKEERKKNKNQTQTHISLYIDGCLSRGFRFLSYLKQEPSLMRHRQHTGSSIDRKCRGGWRSLTVSYIVAAPIIHMGRSFHSHLDDCQYEGFLLGLTTSRYPDETAYVSMSNMATANWKKNPLRLLDLPEVLKTQLKV